MPSFNRIQIMGHLGKDVELRFTPSGKAVANFTVPTNSLWTNSSGEKHEKTDWFDVTCWNKLAESCNQHLAKGSLVFVEGRIELNQWKKQDGTVASKLSIIASKVIFLNKKNKENIEQDLEDDNYCIPF